MCVWFRRSRGADLWQDAGEGRGEWKVVGNNPETHLGNVRAGCAIPSAHPVIVEGALTRSVTGTSSASGTACCGVVWAPWARACGTAWNAGERGVVVACCAGSQRPNRAPCPNRRYLMSVKWRTDCVVSALPHRLGTRRHAPASVSAASRQSLGAPLVRRVRGSGSWCRVLMLVELSDMRSQASCQRCHPTATYAA